MRIGVLAVQGAFIEHLNVLKALGIEGIELRQQKDLEQDLDGLIFPGGESTVQGKLLKDLGMYEVLKTKIQAGLPVLGTCAGMILLAEDIVNDKRLHFATMPIRVRRNAYGRQLGSFFTEENFAGLGKVPMTFIRAPYIEKVSASTDILAVVNNNIVAARYKNQLALSFHPELDTQISTLVHEYFKDICLTYKLCKK